MTNPFKEKDAMNPQKTGLMYSDDFGRYDAGKGYLVFPAG